MRLSFRPHHFLCTLGFQGKGYSPKFIQNYSQIKKALQKNEELSIQVVKASDSICKVCPHQNKKGCDAEEKVSSLDEGHCQILNIKDGDIITWKEAKKLLKEKMTLKAFHQACKGCAWKPLGICESALRNLRHEAS